jgi:hypothetical protein
MRASRTLLIAVGAVAAAGLALDLAASAASRTLSISSTAQSGGTSPPQSGVKSQDLTGALVALAPGGQTLAGPGTFLARTDEDTAVYDVLTGAAVDACATVRNLSRGTIRITATGANSLDVDPGETRAACYAAPARIALDCREGAVCEGVWRIDRQ